MLTEMRRDNANLDLLRSVAVSLVFISHLVMVRGHLDDPIMKSLAVRQLAELGVLLFFVHTSLVLMMSLERLGNGRVVQRFYVRRAFRIYPLAIVAVLVALELRIPPHFELTFFWPPFGVVLQNILLVQNLFQSPEIVGPMWSLPFEVQMYLVLPFIFFAARRIRSHAGIIAMILAGFIIWFVDSHLARAWHYPALLRYAPWFFMGIAAYAGFKIVKPRVRSEYFGPLLLFLISVPALAQHFIGDYRTGWASWTAGILFALALPFIQEVRSTILRRCAHTIATYSYSIYLSHVPIMWFAFQQLSSYSGWVQLGVFIAAIGVIPAALYHLVESPFIRFGSFVAEGLARRKCLSINFRQESHVDEDEKRFGRVVNELELIDHRWPARHSADL